METSAAAETGLGDFRRETYTVKVELKPSYLDSNYIERLKEQLRMTYENKCHPQMGYIKKGSVTLIKKSSGDILGSQFTGTPTFSLTFSCLTTRPLKGSVLVCLVTKKNTTGILAIPRGGLPYIVIVPRNLEMDEHNQALIDSVKVQDTIEIVIEDSQLNPRDKKNNTAKYHIIGRINKTNLANEKVVRLPSLNPVDIIGDIRVVDNVADYPAWKERTEYTNNAGAYKVYPELERVKAKKAELDAEASKLEMKGRRRDETFWDRVKVMINDYELVDELSTMARFSVSRAFYKMHEMIKEQNDIFGLNPPHDIRVLNIAESPGGFIQALIYNRKYNISGSGRDKVDNYYAVSLRERADVTLWNTLQQKTTEAAKKFEEYKTVTWDRLTADTLETADGTTQGAPTIHFVHESHADLTKLSTIDYLLDTCQFKTSKADIITADGGIDVSSHPHLQEIAHYKLFFGEVLTALSTQAHGGTFVLKLFDIFTEFTAKLVGLVSMFYTNIYIYKPYTSRQANSEKYLICTEFNGVPDQTLHTLRKILTEWPADDAFVTSVFGLDITAMLEPLRAYNTQFAAIEIHNVNDGLERGEKWLDDYKAHKFSEITAMLEARRAIQTTESEKFLTEMLELELDLELETKPKTK